MRGVYNRDFVYVRFRKGLRRDILSRGLTVKEFARRIALNYDSLTDAVLGRRVTTTTARKINEGLDRLPVLPRLVT